jgi:hypothetical protein
VLGAEIQGRILNPQAEPVRGATVSVNASNKLASAKVVTAAEGSYAIANLELFRDNATH